VQREWIESEAGEAGARPRLPLVHPAADLTAAAVTVAAAAAIVALLWPLEPAAAGHGTHEQLGWGACSWPGLYGMPCPTCGVTTAACHLLHFEPLAAIATQPFGAALAGSGLVAAGLALARIFAGRPFVPVLARWVTPRMLAGALGLFAAAWGYKILTW
jgi:hypothetical protein